MTSTQVMHHHNHNDDSAGNGGCVATEMRSVETGSSATTQLKSATDVSVLKGWTVCVGWGEEEGRRETVHKKEHQLSLLSQTMMLMRHQ